MGFSQNKIAKKLGRSQPTVSREVTRNKGQRGYRHQQAHRTAQQRHQEKPKAVKLTEDIKRRISDAIICGDWSPEQVAGRLEKEGVIKLHHETIYQFIEEDKRNDGTLYKHLRHQKKTYRKRYGSAHNRTGIPNRVGIEKRPEAANNRERVGDWEADTIIGKNHSNYLLIPPHKTLAVSIGRPRRHHKPSVRYINFTEMQKLSNGCFSFH